MQALAEYILSLEELSLKHNTREAVMTLLTTSLVSDTGYVLVFLSVSTMVPTLLGYVGAVRGSRVLLTLVCNNTFMIVMSILSH